MLLEGVRGGSTFSKRPPPLLLKNLHDPVFAGALVFHLLAGHHILAGIAEQEQDRVGDEDGRERTDKHAEAHGQSVNGFINKAIDEKMERDKS